MKILIEVKDVDSAVDSACNAAFLSQGWSNLDVILVGEHQVKAEAFDQLKDLARSVESLIEYDGFYQL